MLLVTPKRKPGPAGRLANWFTRRRVGRTIEPVRSRCTIRASPSPWAASEQAVDGADALDERLKALVNLKAASIVDCSFRLDIGSSEARKQGVRVDELHAVTDHRHSDLFSAREKLALDYAAALSRSPVKVGDELVGDLRDEFGERELVELNYIVAWENFRARSNSGLEIEATGFTHASRRTLAETASARV